MENIPKCSNSSPATRICINQICHQPNPFICGDNHDCQKDHTTCVKEQWLIFKKRLDENTQVIDLKFKLLYDKVEKVIAKGIEQLKVELHNFNKWKKQYGVMEKIADFYECIQLNREEKWTGKNICQLRNNIRTKFNIEIDSNKIESIVMEIENKRTALMKMIRELYESQKVQTSKHIMKMKTYYLSGINKKLEQTVQPPEHLEIKFVDNQSFSKIGIEGQISCGHTRRV